MTESVKGYLSMKNGIKDENDYFCELEKTIILNDDDADKAHTYTHAHMYAYVNTHPDMH